MIEYFFFAFLWIFVSPPMTGLAARMFDRPFFKWALLGLALPGASLFLLLWVSRNDPPEAKAPEFREGPPDAP